MHKIIDKYLDRSDWRVFENSNIGYSLHGLSFYMAGEAFKQYWLQEVYPKYISDAHIAGDIHIHDLSAGLNSYCMGWDLLDILMRGFVSVGGHVSCKPPRHLRTVLGQVCNFLYTLQNESAGAQAFSSFDTYLAPFVAFDGLEYAQVKQAMQEFIFNMNVPTRNGGQVPFTNLTFDLVCPTHMKDNCVLIGGKPWEEHTYNEFQKEMDMINRAFCEVMEAGDGEGKIFSFPIPTYNLTKKFNWESEVTKYIFRMTAKFGTPYFANYINSDMDPSDSRSLCCRLRINTNKLRRGGLFNSNPLTGSTHVITLNLPAIAYRNKNKGKMSFYKDLTRKLNIAHRAHRIKRERIEKWMEEGLYPYSKIYLENVKKRSGSYYANHFSTFGVLGGHEACLNFLGVGIESEKGKKFMQDVLKFVKKKIERFQKEDGGLYNLEATPGEGTCYSFALKDTKRYGDIAHSGTKDVPYYSGSTQLPVNLGVDILNALKHQNDLTPLYDGGSVFHVFLGESVDDLEAVKAFVRKVAENYEIPYFSITPSFSVCPTHGYIKGTHEYCPTCGDLCSIYSRVVGYFRPVIQWNVGKKQEFKDRKVFTISNEKNKRN